MPAEQGLPVVAKGEALDVWLKRSVPVLMQMHQLDEATATDVATQAWNHINGGATPAADGKAPAADGTAPAAAAPSGHPNAAPADASAYGKPAPGEAPPTPDAAAGAVPPKGKAPATAAPGADGAVPPKGKTPGENPFAAKKPADGAAAPGADPAATTLPDGTQPKNPALHAQMTGKPAPAPGATPGAAPNGVPAPDGKPMAPLPLQQDAIPP